MKTLDELAMDYAVASLDPSIEALTQMKVLSTEADHILAEMERRFDIYQLHQAIARAQEILKMIMPEDQFVIVT